MAGTSSSGLVLTNKLTGMATVGLDTPEPAISTSPEHVPANKPDVFICTLMVLGVTPVCCEITSQPVPQLSVLALAEKFTLAPVLLWTVRVCAAGGLNPS